MHNQMLGDQESHTAQDNSNAYGTDGSWGVDMHSFQNHHQTTMPEYNGSSFSFMPSISHGLPSESLHRMPPPPPPHSMAQAQQTTLPQLPPQLPMLVMPSHATWPSMLTNPNSYSSHSAPSMSIPPIQVAPRVQGSSMKTKLPALHTQPVPRKTLTDDDRKRMCQYAEDHPHAKQTDIGARFGVERSTVSKVLRNKEKYLYPEQKDSAASSPVKRKSKGGVDIERALTNYVRNAQKSGVTVTDADIKDKARLFSATMGKPDDGVVKVSSSSWLEKFKQKNGIGHGRLMRRASETNIPDSIRGSPSLSASQPSSAISPNSPSAHLSPSPLSADRSEDGKENMNHFMDFNTEPGAYKHSNSQSTTSLSSAFTDGGGSSFSGSALSPSATPFTFSPDSNVGAFLDHGRQLPGGVGSNFQRPRSQTFPTLDLEYMSQQQNTEPLTPRYHVSSTAPSSALESPANEIPQPTYGMDHAISSPQLRHSSSNNSLTGRGGSAANSAVASSPNSPTQEDARRAADTLLSFISHVGGFVDQSEYMTVVRLTEKLRLHMSQMGKSTGQQGMGGLDRIPEQDSEMSNASPDALGIKAE